MAYIVQDSEQNMQGRISQVCTAKASLDGTIQWIVLHIIRNDTDFEKVGMATIAATKLKRMGVPVEIEEITMEEHLEWMCRLMSRSSYRMPLLGHSLDRDIQFMFKSAPEFFNGDPLRSPGTQRTSWQRINKVCTQRLITSCCPRTHQLANPDGRPRSTLDQYVNKLLLRTQKHNSVDDVIDLIEVLKIAHAYDNIRLPRENFLIIRPDNSVNIQEDTA
jgi:hypothetical protein